MKQYKTLIIPVKCSLSDYNYLNECNQKSAEVWNRCLEIDKQYREENEGKWIGRSEFQKRLKSCGIHLHVKGIQHVMRKYIFARSAIQKSKCVGRTDNLYPYKKKKYFVTGWDYQSINVDYTKGIIYLSKPMKLDINTGKYQKQKPVKCYAKNIPQNIVEIELVYKDKLYLAIKFYVEVIDNRIQSNNSASIDLGEIHSITSIDFNANAIIITGRKLRSIKQLRNKHQADIYRRMSKCRKGSKQYRKYVRALNRLKAKFDRKINDCVHKITKLYLDYCLENQISTVYYGDLDSATRGTKQKGKGSVNVRQKLSQWNYGQIVRQLENKLSRYGIKLVQVKEYRTSSKCPTCGIINKPTNRNYECSCGYKQHRDIVGAINILNDNARIKLTHYQTKKYLRIA